MRSNRYLRSAGLLVLLGTMVQATQLLGQNKDPQGSGKDEIVRDPLLRSGWEAFQASTTNLRTGRGEGIYQEFASDPNDAGKMKMIVDASCKVQFDSSKYRIALKYKTDLVDRIESRVIIYDGATLACSQFTPRQKPYGAEADLFHPDGGAYSASQCGFHYDLPSLTSQVLPLAAIRQKGLFPAVVMTKMPDGGLSGKVKNDELLYEFEFSPQIGFNTAEWRTSREGVVFKTVRAKWEKKSDLWYVASIETVTEPIDAPSKNRRVLFRYDQFEPNVPIPLDTFKLKGLNLPDGARILDRRDGKTEIFRNLKLKQTDQKKIDSLIEQIKQLPSDGIATRNPETSGTLRTVLYIIGGILVILGLWLGWRRRAAKVRS